MSKTEYLELRYAIYFGAECIIIVMLMGIWFLSTGGWAYAGFILFLLSLFGFDKVQKRRKIEIAAAREAP